MKAQKNVGSSPPWPYDNAVSHDSITDSWSQLPTDLHHGVAYSPELPLPHEEVADGALVVPRVAAAAADYHTHPAARGAGEGQFGGQGRLVQEGRGQGRTQTRAVQAEHQVCRANQAGVRPSVSSRKSCDQGALCSFENPSYRCT